MTRFFKQKKTNKLIVNESSKYKKESIDQELKLVCGTSFIERKEDLQKFKEEFLLKIEFLPFSNSFLYFHE